MTRKKKVLGSCQNTYASNKHLLQPAAFSRFAVTHILPWTQFLAYFIGSFRRSKESCCCCGQASAGPKLLFVCPTDEGHLFQAEPQVIWIRIISFIILLELDKNVALTRYVEQRTSSNYLLLVVSISILLTDAHLCSGLQPSMGENWNSWLGSSHSKSSFR